MCGYSEQHWPVKTKKLISSDYTISSSHGQTLKITCEHQPQLHLHDKGSLIYDILYLSQAESKLFFLVQQSAARTFWRCSLQTWSADLGWICAKLVTQVAWEEKKNSVVQFVKFSMKDQRKWLKNAQHYVSPAASLSFLEENTLSLSLPCTASEKVLLLSHYSFIIRLKLPAIFSVKLEMGSDSEVRKLVYSCSRLVQQS